jgi:hypothetical protein
LLALLLATEKKISQHEAFANKKHSTNETFFFFCACQHAKPLISRHFKQSQATKKMHSSRKFTTKLKGKAMQAKIRSVKDHALKARMNEKREGEKQGKGTNGQ